MDTEQYLRDQREALRASVEYFRSANIAERNLWVGREFLKNLNVPFRDSEVTAPVSDPPDATYLDLRFEVKEILDEGRKRHAEYRAALEKAQKATDPEELLSDYSPKDLTPVEVVDLIASKLPAFSNKYAPAFLKTLDLLVYINLTEHSLRPGAMPDCTYLHTFGWRSISAVFGWASFVLNTHQSAPEFLQTRVGILTFRHFE
jgi:hypothetical protein